MILNDGDIVTIDGVEMEVTNATSSGYWFKERGGGLYYYSMVFHTPEQFSKLITDGRASLGTIKAVKPGSANCTYHTWKKYIGATELYDYCSRCDAKRDRDWRDIKDGKDF